LNDTPARQLLSGALNAPVAVTLRMHYLCRAGYLDMEYTFIQLHFALLFTTRWLALRSLLITLLQGSASHRVNIITRDGRIGVELILYHILAVVLFLSRYSFHAPYVRVKARSMSLNWWLYSVCKIHIPEVGGIRYDIYLVLLGVFNILVDGARVLVFEVLQKLFRVLLLYPIEFILGKPWHCLCRAFFFADENDVVFLAVIRRDTASVEGGLDLACGLRLIVPDCVQVWVAPVRLLVYEYRTGITKDCKIFREHSRYYILVRQSLSRN
jgi:hypothetical protein